MLLTGGRTGGDSVVGDDRTTVMDEGTSAHELAELAIFLRTRSTQEASVSATRAVGQKATNLLWWGVHIPSMASDEQALLRQSP